MTNFRRNVYSSLPVIIMRHISTHCGCRRYNINVSHIYTLWVQAIQYQCVTYLQHCGCRRYNINGRTVSARPFEVGFSLNHERKCKKALGHSLCVCFVLLHNSLWKHLFPSIYHILCSTYAGINLETNGESS